ncbi:histidine phosphatase family protein [Paenibacillus cellulositrophicus]|uniref:histidine phosphatase family protein n=1 Tax=Paenibacillus cellulositrophicus TaxID=562959 RepID=UPI00203AE648|nr:histidine phosphatase family protein [Paenibacillus cellulositrophicus]MCM2996122.1 histidine phosphatase family protein [Paenibacillus cellulositrophicus]
MDVLVKQLDLLLVRHGTTRWNREKRYLGHTDIPLDPGGRDELAPLARELVGKAFHGVYCSDLARCRETLAIISLAHADTAMYDPRLREMDFGAWEGHTYEQLQHELLYRQWIDSPQQVTPPGGESWADFAGRIDGFVGSLLKDVEGACSRPAGIQNDGGTALPGSKGIGNGGSALPRSKGINIGGSALSESQRNEIGEAALPGSQTSDDSEAVLSRSEGPEGTGPESQVPPEMLIVAHGGVLRQLAVRLVPGLSFWDVHAQPGSLLRIRLSFSEEIGGWNGKLVNQA